MKTNFATAMGNVKWFLNELRLPKYDFYRELNPLDRIYDLFHMTLFCYIAQNGIGLFYFLPTTVNSWGIYFSVFLFIYGCVEILSVICYAEMAALMPSTGAAYHYCYYSMGEFVAFLAGWNIIFGQITAIYVKCSFLRHFFDKVFFNNWIEETLTLPKYSFHDIFILGGKFDFILLIIVVLLSVFTTALVKKGKYICSVMTCTCIFILLLFGVIFFYHMRVVNTVKKKRNIQAFAASCLVHAVYSYSGYEVISVLGEEAINPTETIPKSLLISMKWSIFINVLWTVQIALVWPGIIEDRPWPMRAIMETIKLQPLKWFSFIGFVCGALGSLYASYFLLVRILYAMSRDGLICSFFSKVDRRTNSPFIPALVLALVLCVVAILVKTDDLLFQPAVYSIIGTKMFVYVVLLFTRYECKKEMTREAFDTQERWVLFNWPRPQKTPTPVTHAISMKLIFILTLSSFLLIQALMTMRTHHLDYSWLKLIALFAGIILISAAILLCRQPQNSIEGLLYSAPDVPFVPLIAMLSDFLVGFNEAMKPHLWVPLIGWMTVGVIFYLSFSFKNSNQRRMMNPDGSKWQIMDSGREGVLGEPSSEDFEIKKNSDSFMDSSNYPGETADEDTAESQPARTVSVFSSPRSIPESEQLQEETDKDESDNTATEGRRDTSTEGRRDTSTEGRRDTSTEGRRDTSTGGEVSNAPSRDRVSEPGTELQEDENRSTREGI